MPIEHVFFDAGETLLRPYPSFGELFSVTARDHGVAIDADEVNEVRRRLAPFLLELAEDSGVDQPSLLPERSYDFWGYVYRRFLAELGFEDETLVRRLFEVFSDSASYKLYDDSLPTLLDLQSRGYRLGLISNFEGWLEKLLIELEVGHLFDTTVISAVEGIEKPDPAIYHLALERSGASPDRSVMVGDSPANDVEPSAQVGMIPVLLDRSGSYATLDGYPKVTSLKELPDVLENL
jgi:putative hydrolase of the HAD superfamily